MDVLRHFVPCVSVCSLVLDQYWCCTFLLFRIWKGWLQFAKELSGGLGFVVILLQGHSLLAAVMCWSIVRSKFCSIAFVMHITVIVDSLTRIGFLNLAR